MTALPSRSSRRSCNGSAPPPAPRTGFAPVAYDAAIVNLYEAGAKLGLHQDKIEGAEVVAAGSPVVTISLGDRCVFRFGNTDRPSRPYTDVELASGDLFVFGGPSRLAFHGVPKTYPGSALPSSGSRAASASRCARSARRGRTPTERYEAGNCTCSAWASSEALSALRMYPPAIALFRLFVYWAM